MPLAESLWGKVVSLLQRQELEFCQPPGYGVDCFTLRIQVFEVWSPIWPCQRMVKFLIWKPKRGHWGGTIAPNEDYIILLLPSVSSVRVSCFKEKTSPLYGPGLRFLRLSCDVFLCIPFKHCDSVHWEAFMATTPVPHYALNSKTVLNNLSCL